MSVMPTNAASLTTAFESRKVERMIDLLDERVVWRGLAGGGHDPDMDHDDAGDHDHGPPICTDRDQVRDVFERFLAGGGAGHPVVLAEVGDTVVVDPRPDPPQPYPLHQAFTFLLDRVVLIQDYPDRASALRDIGL
jgi:hypothetical protein